MTDISLYRQQLPQLNGELFLTDGGLETTLVFLQNIELPLFAAFDLLSVDHGRARLFSYYEKYLQHAASHQRHFLLETPTWRANPDWAQQLGYSSGELVALNRASVEMMLQLRQRFASGANKIVISGCVGPRGDGYSPGQTMTAEEARQYHALQINTFADTAADLVSAMTLNYVEEAIGIVQAAQQVEMPVVISFTTETDGRLPTGQSLQQAITMVDEATGQGPAYYMINCAHPDHFRNALEPGADWVRRIRSIRANASRKSHAELDDSTELDRGSPDEFGSLYRSLLATFPQLAVLGGCCGTDLEHIAAVDRHCCST